MGELTREAASKPPLRLSVGLMRGHPSPSSSPLPGFSVFSMPFYRHQSVWRGDTTRPVSPGVGPWICEIGKLSVSLPSSILHFPRFLLSCFFHHASKPSFSPSGRDKGTIGFFGIFGRIRRYVTTYYFFQFQFSIFSTSNGEEKSRYLFQNSLDRVYTEFESISDIGFEGGVRVIFITKSKLETIGALEFQFRRVIRVRG